MASDLTQGAQGIAALADPVRRELYEYVVRQPAPVGREQAAEGVGIPLHKAKFHLDRLAEEGLLDVEYQRLSGRTGPGAGRPSKLYRRSATEISVSLPQRQYDLIGQILAQAVDVAATQQVAVRDAARRAARSKGREIGTASTPAGSTDLERTAHALEGQGYEPRVDHDKLLLENCPFHRLADEHTELVCGLNLDFIDGVIEGLGCDGVVATLDPSPGRCCVSARPRTSGNGPALASVDASES